MATWTDGVDRANDYVVTHTNWNDLLGASGSLMWLHTFQGVRATKSAQSVASGSFVKVSLDTETFDPNSWFDNATNFRFQPTHAGKYRVSGNIKITAANGLAYVALYKNGSARIFTNQIGAASDMHMDVSDVIDLNGSTDYVELFVQHSHGSNRNVDGILSAHFVGA
jgi:hypothetical protein